MSTKLIVSVDGLLISNFQSVVSSRSISEVILVNTRTGFNGLSETQRNNIATVKTNLNSASPSTALKIAFNDGGSGALNDEFYNWLSSNNISFFNDPNLQSLSDGLVLESSAISGSSIDANSLSNFNSTTLSSNRLYVTEVPLLH